MTEIEFLTIPTGTPYKKDLGDCTIGDLEQPVRFRKEMAEINEEDGIEHSEYCQRRRARFRKSNGRRDARFGELTCADAVAARGGSRRYREGGCLA